MERLYPVFLFTLFGSERLMKTFFFLLIFSATFFSCSNDLSINLPIEPSRLVVESYLSVGDSLLVRVGESVPPNSKNPYKNIISNADVRISVDGVAHQLSFSSYGFGFREGGFYFLPRASHRVQATKQYDLVVTHNGRKATSSTTTFPPIVLLRAEEFASVFSGKDTMIGLRIQTDFPQDDSYFQCQWIIQVPIEVNIVGKDTIVTFIGVFKKQFLHRAGEATIVEFNTGHKKPQEKYGEYIGFVKLTRITKLQHDFLQAIGVQKDDYSLFTETTHIPTNIEGGYGIFTSTVSDTLTVSVAR